MKKQASHSISSPRPEPKLTFVYGGNDFFEQLHKIISEARTELHLQTYIWDPDATGMAVVEALKDAVKRQVRVTVMIDAFGSADLPKAVLNELVSAGVRLRLFGPWLSWYTLYLGRRLHHKVVVADGRVSMIGGINIADKYHGTAKEKAWLDYAVLIESVEIGVQVAKLCEAHFAKRFRYRRKPIVAGAAGNRVTVLVNDWLLGKNEIELSYRKAIRMAKHDLTIVGTYFLPNRRLSYSLRKAAQRGVEIKLILTGKSDVPIVQRATAYLYDRFLRHGLKLYEWPHSVLHGKAAVVDGHWTTVGSFNVNRLSAYGSIEMNVAVESVAFAVESTRAFEAAIAECTEITEGMLVTRQRWYVRLLNWTSYHIVSTGFAFLTFTAYWRLGGWRKGKKRVGGR